MKRVYDEYGLVERYVGKNFDITLERGSLSSNRVSGYTVRDKDGNSVDLSFQTLSEAKQLVEKLENKLTMKETYREKVYEGIAAALPWEIRTALLTARDYQDDTAMLENLYFKLPENVYIALVELCYVSDWDEKTRNGLVLTRAGKHIANHCTC